MKKWEYMIEYVAFVKGEKQDEKESYITERLNIHGENGWELVQMGGYFV